MNPETVYCPVCGADCGTFVLNWALDILGCENCTHEVDAVEHIADLNEKEDYYGNE